MAQAAAHHRSYSPLRVFSPCRSQHVKFSFTPSSLWTADLPIPIAFTPPLKFHTTTPKLLARNQFPFLEPPNPRHRTRRMDCVGRPQLCDPLTAPGHQPATPWQNPNRFHPPAPWTSTRPAIAASPRPGPPLDRKRVTDSETNRQARDAITHLDTIFLLTSPTSPTPLMTIFSLPKPSPSHTLPSHMQRPSPSLHLYSHQTQTNMRKHLRQTVYRYR